MLLVMMIKMTVMMMMIKMTVMMMMMKMTVTRSFNYLCLGRKWIW